MLLHPSRTSRTIGSYAPGRLSSFVVLAALAAVMTPATVGWLSSASDAPLVAPTGSTELATATSRPVLSMLDPTALNYTQQLERTAAPRDTAAAPEHADTQSPSPREIAAPAPIIPLPVRRPAELSTPKATEPGQLATGPSPQRRKPAAVPAAPEDNRSYIEKLFGVQPSPPTALSYAALRSPDNPAAGGALGPKSNPAAAGTAIYDLSAKAVYLPNGEKLEAHSGLGDKLDDPRYVHVRMHGATPPGTYELSEREQPFHGVRALRLNPVGGSPTVYGRAGLLAHTYMLGPRGDSNGCVSFKDYDKFLQAYLRGEVRRLVVVAARGQDGPFAIFSSRT
jgi:Protein of unknown function (DUF2778)